MAIRNTSTEPMALPEPKIDRRLPNAVLGVIVFIAAEVMFFAGLISAHTIARTTILGGVWPPPGQPRLPVERTLINTAALLLSGILLWWGGHKVGSAGGTAYASMRRSGLWLIGAALALGIAFVCLQGVEWIALLREGLTIRSGPHGAFFYLIVGMHALHAVAAIIAVAWTYSKMLRGGEISSAFTAAQVFWYFVVVLWPIIYWRVYL